MGFFRRKEENRMDFPFNHFIGKVKDEMNILTQWLHYFYKKNDEHDIRIRLLEHKVRDYVKDKDYSKLNEIKALEQQQEALLNHIKLMQKRMNILLEAQEPVLDQIEELDKKLIANEQKNNPLHESLKELHNRLSLLEKINTKPKENKENITNTLTGREKIARKVAKKSKEYIKHTVQTLIEKYEKIAGLQLREIVVDEQGLCSKSTFYRLLQELENEECVGSIREVKEKIYFSQVEKPVLRK